MTSEAVSRGEARLPAVAAAVTVVLAGALAALVRWDVRLAGRVASEGHVIESAQVVLLAAAAALAARWAWQAWRAGARFALPALMVAMLAAVIIGEADLDKQVFGVKVIATRFFVDGRYPIGLRLLAVLVVAGVPLVLAAWALRRRRELWEDGLGLLRAPWGWLLVIGAVVLVGTEAMERALNRVPGLPRNFLEEALELLAATYFFLGLLARPREPQRRRPAA